MEHIPRNILKQARENKNMSHLEIAGKAGISRAYYTNIELGRKTPSLSVAHRIAEILDEGTDIFLQLMFR